jgi:phosphoglucosamine mutase
VLLRPSGTEPIIRVMVEGDNQELVEQQVKIIAGVVEGQVG